MSAPDLPPALQNRGRLARVPRPLRRPVQRAADLAKKLYLVAGGFLRLFSLRRLGPRTAATWRWWRAITADSRRRRGEDGLTVAVDITPLFDTLTGVGWYLHQVLAALDGRPGVRLRLYGPSMFTAPHDPTPVVPLPDGPGIEYVHYPVPDDLVLPRGSLLPILRALEPRRVAGDGNQVLFAPNFIPPRQFRRSTAPLVAMVHDLTLHKTPWTMQAVTREEQARDLDRTVARAAALLTPSETVRADLIAHFGVPAATVHATPEAGRLDAVAPGARPDAVPARFALHVGTIEPRKNVGLLLEAWTRLRAARKDVPPLVLCGKRGWLDDEAAAALDRATSEGWVIRPGYADDATVRALYLEAALVLCPSIYEGFGLPVVEALGAGRALVCSDIPVFREVADDAVLYAPPDDPDAWATAVGRILDDPALAGALGGKGRARAATFSWRRTADQTVAVWETVAGYTRRSGAAATR